MRSSSAQYATCLTSTCLLKMRLVQSLRTALQVALTGNGVHCTTSSAGRLGANMSQAALDDDAHLPGSIPHLKNVLARLKLLTAMSAEVEKIIASIRSTQRDIYAQLREMEDYVSVLEGLILTASVRQSSPPILCSPSPPTLAAPPPSRAPSPAIGATTQPERDEDRGVVVVG